MKTYYEDRFLIVHQADNGFWLLDYAPGDPEKEKNLGVFHTKHQACEARARVLADNRQYDDTEIV